jgi:hypothetical protein
VIEPPLPGIGRTMRRAMVAAEGCTRTARFCTVPTPPGPVIFTSNSARPRPAAVTGIVIWLLAPAAELDRAARRIGCDEHRAAHVEIDDV